MVSPAPGHVGEAKQGHNANATGQGSYRLLKENALRAQVREGRSWPGRPTSDRREHLWHYSNAGQPRDRENEYHTCRATAIPRTSFTVKISITCSA